MKLTEARSRTGEENNVVLSTVSWYSSEDSCLQKIRKQYTENWWNKLKLHEVRETFALGADCSIIIFCWDFSLSFGAGDMASPESGWVRTGHKQNSLTERDRKIIFLHVLGVLNYHAATHLFIKTKVQDLDLASLRIPGQPQSQWINID